MSAFGMASAFEPCPIRFVQKPGLLQQSTGPNRRKPPFQLWQSRPLLEWDLIRTSHIIGADHTQVPKGGWGVVSLDRADDLGNCGGDACAKPPLTLFESQFISNPWLPPSDAAVTRRLRLTRFARLRRV